jgi:hypothetical protein
MKKENVCNICNKITDKTFISKNKYYCLSCFAKGAENYIIGNITNGKFKGKQFKIIFNEKKGTEIYINDKLIENIIAYIISESCNGENAFQKKIELKLREI